MMLDNKKTTNPEVSVIIPTYNSSEYIVDCIDAVCADCDVNMEVICINDGSTDNSLELLENLKTRYESLIVISQSNKGLSYARNRGLEIARGKYIVFVDSDDILESRYIEQAVNICNRDNLDVVFYSYQNFYHDEAVRARYTKKIGINIRKGQYPDRIVSGEELLWLFSENDDLRITACISIVRNDFLKKHNIVFYNGMVYEDALYVMQLLFNSKRTKCINEPWYLRRIRLGSVEHSDVTPFHVWSIFKGIVLILEEYEKYSFENSKTERAVMGLLQRRVLFYARKFFTLSDEQKKQLEGYFSLDDRLFYDSLIVPYLEQQARLNETIKNKKTLEQEIKQIKKHNRALIKTNEQLSSKNKALVKRNKKILNSHSYRFGNFCVKPLKAIRDMFK